MTEDCPDGDDSPAGSVEDLLEDFRSAADAFREKAAEDLAKRKADDAVPVGTRTDAEPDLEGGNFVRDPTQYDPTTRQRPFNPRPLLLLQHDAESRGRPLKRRPEAVPPLSSDSVTVQTPDGEPAERIVPGETYEVSVSVRNLGGVPARSACVELFVDDREADATFDLPQGSDVLRMRRSGSARQNNVSGHTTFTSDRVLFAHMYSEAPGENIAGGNYLEQFASQQLDGDILDILGPVDMEAIGGRTFRFDTDDILVDGDPSFVPVEEFRILLFQVPESEYDPEDSLDAIGAPARYLESSQGDQSKADPFVAEQTATFDPDPPPTRPEPLQLSRDLDEQLSDRLDKERVTVPQNGETTVTFQYEPTQQPNEKDLVLTTFHARAYALGHDEVPEEWGEIDHTGSRFFARTEVTRTL